MAASGGPGGGGTGVGVGDVEVEELELELDTVLLPEDEEVFDDEDLVPVALGSIIDVAKRRPSASPLQVV